MILLLAEGHSTTFLTPARTQKIPCLRVFLEKNHLSFSVQRKNIVFPQKQTPSFQIIQESSCSGVVFWKRSSFQNTWRKYYIFMCFFEKVHLSFSVQEVRSYFRKNRNIIFTDNTKNIIFQREFFGKTIFSGRPEKENMVFRPWYEVPLKLPVHLGLANLPIKLNAKLVFTL